MRPWIIFLLFTSASFGQITTPIKNPKLTGAADFDSITNKSTVRTHLGAQTFDQDLTDFAAAASWNGLELTLSGVGLILDQVEAVGFTGSGAGLDTLNASNLSTGTVPTGRLPAPFDWVVWRDGATYYAVNQRDGVTRNDTDCTELVQWIHDNSIGAASINFATIEKTAPSTYGFFEFTGPVILTKTISLYGEGNPQTIFKLVSGDGPVIQYGTVGTEVGGIARVRDIRFEGSTGSATAVGIKFLNCAEPNVRGCEFNNFGGSGVEVACENNSFWSSIIDSWFVVASGAKGLAVTGDADAIASDMLILGCHFSGGGPLGGVGVSVTGAYRNISITGNRFEQGAGSSPSIQIDAGTNFTITGNIFIGHAVAPVNFGNRGGSTNVAATVTGNSWGNSGALVTIGTNVIGVHQAANANNNRVQVSELPVYTVSTVPAAATYPNSMIYISNETGGATPAFSDGTNWRRVTDRTVISE